MRRHRHKALQDHTILKICGNDVEMKRECVYNFPNENKEVM